MSCHLVSRRVLLSCGVVSCHAREERGNTSYEHVTQIYAAHPHTTHTDTTKDNSGLYMLSHHSLTTHLMRSRSVVLHPLLFISFMYVRFPLELQMWAYPVLFRKSTISKRSFFIGRRRVEDGNYFESIEQIEPFRLEAPWPSASISFASATYIGSLFRMLWTLSDTRTAIGLRAGQRGLYVLHSNALNTSEGPGSQRFCDALP